MTTFPRSRRRAARPDAHDHDAYRCPAHVDGCGCPDLDNWQCNPYYVAGHCPDAIDVMPPGQTRPVPGVPAERARA